MFFNIEKMYLKLKYFTNESLFVFNAGQISEYTQWWHHRWEPKADIGIDLDHHPSLPGKFTFVTAVSYLIM